MIDVNWDTIQENDGTFNNPEPGGYIAVISDYEDNEQKQYLKIFWDFAEGEFQGYNQETFDRAGFWPTALFRSYKPKALGFFKSFKACLEASNRGYRFDTRNLDAIIGKKFGVVLGEEQYLSNSGEPKNRLYVAQTRSIQAIREKDYKAPPFKPLKAAPVQQSAYPAPDYGAALSFDDEDVPF
ncbi:MAG: hypothetical protein LUE61_07125 [Clostridiales bacterium]|nr:hypothetical protein [Clostridiales bacterium]